MDPFMNTAAVIWIVLALIVACCLFTHRRVIRALIRHEDKPVAPKWHVWCKNRKS